MKNRFSLLLAALVFYVFPAAGNAAMVTYTDPSAYFAQIAAQSLTETGFTNFDSTGPGALGTSFMAGGIQFTSPIAMSIANGTTSSGSFFLGLDSLLNPDFQTGDQITLTMPANTRAVSLNVITDTPPDLTAFASLTVNGQGAIMVPGGTELTGGFRSYFLGLINDSADIGSAVIDFSGTGLAFYRVDDVSIAGLAAIPEPSSLLLVATGLMPFLRRRTRRI
jgi:hypothetical protein